MLPPGIHVTFRNVESLLVVLDHDICCCKYGGLTVFRFSQSTEHNTNNNNTNKPLFHEIQWNGR